MTCVWLLAAYLETASSTFFVSLEICEKSVSVLVIILLTQSFDLVYTPADIIASEFLETTSEKNPFEWSKSPLNNVFIDYPLANN